MEIVPPAETSDSAWLALRSALWPDSAEAEHLAGMADALARHHYVRLALNADGSAAGFVEASKRVDYVNGTNSSPVAFLEGIYVEPGFRRRGVARALVDSVVNWALAEGCVELASDSLLDNEAAHAVHCALGFEETERVVYFRQSLHDVDPALSRSSSTNFTPKGWRTVTPRIVSTDSRTLVDFVKKVFEATGEYRNDAPTVLSIGDSIIMISDAGARGPTPAFLYVYVCDADETYRLAMSEGATSVEDPRDLPYGDRRAMIEDRWGNIWQIATTLPATRHGA